MSILYYVSDDDYIDDELEKIKMNSDNLERNYINEIINKNMDLYRNMHSNRCNEVCAKCLKKIIYKEIMSKISLIKKQPHFLKN